MKRQIKLNNIDLFILFIIMISLSAGCTPAVKDKTVNLRADNTAIDKHALAAPPRAEKDTELLAKYLTSPYKDDYSKSRAIYRWITDRISYDIEGLLTGKFASNGSAASTLTGRKSVCEGYANLFQDLALKSGLESVKITGYSRGYGFSPGEKIESNHAWNAVKLNGNWYLLDSTWGAGHITNNKFVKRFNNSQFLVQPEEFVYTHFPDDPGWQLMGKPVAKNKYSAYPALNNEFFNLGLGYKQGKDHGRNSVHALIKIPDGMRIFTSVLRYTIIKNLNSTSIRMETDPVLGKTIVKKEKDNQIELFMRLPNNNKTYSLQLFAGKEGDKSFAGVGELFPDR